MTVRQKVHGWVTAGAATTDQVLAAVTLLGRKIDTLISEMGIVMTTQDDINAMVAALTDTVSTLTTETGVLTDAVPRIEAAIAALQDANPALDLTALTDEMKLVSPAVARLTPAVSAVAAIAPTPTPAPPPPAGP